MFITHHPLKFKLLGSAVVIVSALSLLATSKPMVAGAKMPAKPVQVTTPAARVGALQHEVQNSKPQMSLSEQLLFAREQALAKAGGGMITQVSGNAQQWIFTIQQGTKTRVVPVNK
ncbi:MAG: hypothetical protein C7B47_06450 [Sulfobacillus thermosulfidooxidans]|uniref:Uncharacterized protein n=1 Tax=Sulfobacillus thermosulfidooxidans TaxID=28034 RepID=A0A2T2X098_SULTH|nr:MAG: hypothetical protein C7B47_06450 [Sulfobacillus thermosulfidooxidans]